MPACGPLQHTSENGEFRAGPDSESKHWHTISLPSKLKLLHDYVYYIACITIGGKEEYEKFLEHRASLGETDACSQLECRDVVERINLYVTSRLDLMPQSTSVRMKRLCDLIRGHKTMPVNKGIFWTTCAITGATINKSLEICGQSSFNVCMSFAPFVWSFWILTHIKELEEDRIIHFMRDGRSDIPISTMIHNFKESVYYASESDIETYEKAISIVIDSLHLSTGD